MNLDTDEMTDTTFIGLPEAARRLGVHMRVLRRAIRTGDLPALPQLGATAPVPESWVATAREKIAASPTSFNRAFTQKVPPFARYVGTSAWRKFRVRVRAYAAFEAAEG